MKIFKLLSTNSRGMALLMIITSVALMTIVLADLTFETQLNKIKIYNLQDRTQAKLNAEAGLRFAIAKLKLYQQAINLINKDENLKGIIKPSALESVVTTPFIFPIPEFGEMSLIQKNALEEFSENTVLKGSLSVSMQSVSGFLNPNNMRVFKKSEEDRRLEQQQQQNNVVENEEDANKPPQQYIEDKLVERLRTSMEAKRESDDIFDAKYGNLREEMLIKELKYYVSDPGDFDDPEIGEIESLYSSAETQPKHAPMTSIDEMYLLQGWPDDVVNLIINDITVHEVAVIQVNNITKDQLKIVFPNITDIQIEEFFKYRDGDPERDEPPKPFKTEDEFKSVVTGYLGIIGTTAYEDRVKELEAAGLRIGVAGKLFRVESIGEFERARFRLVAYVDLPAKPVPEKKKDEKNQNGTNNQNNTNNQDQQNDDQTGEVSDGNDQENKEEEEEPVEYLEPRVIEIRSN